MYILIIRRELLAVVPACFQIIGGLPESVDGLRIELVVGLGKWERDWIPYPSRRGLVSLGADPHLPRGYIENTLRTIK